MEENPAARREGGGPPVVRLRPVNRPRARPVFQRRRGTVQRARHAVGHLDVIAIPDEGDQHAEHVRVVLRQASVDGLRDPVLHRQVDVLDHPADMLRQPFPASPKLSARGPEK